MVEESRKTRDRYDVSAQSRRPLLVYDQSEEGQRKYIEAAKAAFKRDYAPIVEIIRQALARAENRQ